MKKIKKVLAGIILAAAAGCVAAAVGCSSSPDYYSLTLDAKGADIVFSGALAPEDGESFVSGGTVREGVQVTFSVVLGENTEGEQKVYVNDELLTAAEDGTYTFVMSKNTVVRVDGLTEKKTITLSSGDYRIEYRDVDGNPLEEENLVSYGTDFKFTLWVSPYYVRQKEGSSDEDDTAYMVTCDTEELVSVDGVYTIENVTASSTVNVTNLVQEDSFAERGEGSGTADDPFIIRKPIDMYYAASLVNSEYYLDYNAACFKMEADIDMDGEQLYTIGIGSGSSDIFCGSFDGNDHTISNFTLTDEYVNQDDYTTSYLSYVGLFGYAAATTSSAVVIKDLTLKDYTLSVHPSMLETNTASYSGSLVGYGIGVQIENCCVSGGTITSEGNKSNMAYLGGIVGLLQSAYRNDTVYITYDSYVYGCTVQVNITGTGSPRSAGGIVGYAASASVDAIAYVSDCSVTGGVIEGAMHSGGIVGSLGRFSSVNNCYAGNAVIAANQLTGTAISDSFKVAYAGGIVGYAENDTVISNCYAANTNVSTLNTANDTVKKTGDICGWYAEAQSDAQDSAVVVTPGSVKKQSTDTSSVYTTLGWSKDEWDFTGTAPVPKNVSSRTIKIELYCGGVMQGEYPDSSELASPIYTWYGEGESDLPEYYVSNGQRSYGYYFDTDLTQKVPYGYIPTGTVKLYFGLADYSEAAGTYYLGSSETGVNPYIELKADGSYSFRDGGMTFDGVYSYDGENIWLYNTSLGLLTYSAEEVNGESADVLMTASSGGYTIKGIILLTVTDSDGDSSYESNALSFTAVKVNENFVYGEYKIADTENTVSFNKNGTVVYTVWGDEPDSFTITEAGGTFTIKLEEHTLAIVVGTDGVVSSFAGKSVQLKDDFAGEWSISANSAYKFAFDGLGGVTYTTPSGAKTGEYTINNGEATFTFADSSVTYKGAKFGADGLLYIDGVAYSYADGFTGVWYGMFIGDDTSTELGRLTENFELELCGTGANGYGSAVITYSSGSVVSYEGEYSVSDGAIAVYVGDELYAERAVSSDGAAVWSFYSRLLYNSYGTKVYVSAAMNMYDMFKGDWVTDLAGYSSLNFTGKGAEDGGSTVIATKTSGSTLTGKYVVSNSAVTLTLGDNSYTLTLDEITGKITAATESGATGTLARTDDWYGVTLYDGETSYTFDGRGNVAGTVSVSDGSALAYTVSDGSVTIGGYPLAAGESGFAWNGKTLVFRTGFAGTWCASGDNAQAVITEVTANMTANVTIGGSTYSFEYDAVSGTLVGEYGGKTVTIGVLGSYELSFTESSSGESEYTIYISSDKLDGKGGTYTADDGSSWTFDGHGYGKYGSGSATYKSGKTTEGYTYTIDTLGYICIRMSGVRYLFVEAESGYKAEGASVAYTTKKTDSFYLTELQISDAYYLTDGIGNFWSASGDGYEKTSVYTYIRLSSSRLIVTENGVKKLGVVASGRLTLNEYKEYTCGDKKYILDGSASLYLVSGDTYTFAYYYEVDEDDASIYYLTDSDGAEYIMTIGKDGSTITIEVDE